jgi:hypothetical protein
MSSIKKIMTLGFSGTVAANTLGVVENKRRIATNRMTEFPKETCKDERVCWFFGKQPNLRAG